MIFFIYPIPFWLISCRWNAGGWKTALSTGITVSVCEYNTSLLILQAEKVIFLRQSG